MFSRSLPLLRRCCLPSGLGAIRRAPALPSSTSISIRHHTSSVVPFDTNQAIVKLEEGGLTRVQAQAVVAILVHGMEESRQKSTELIATKRDLLDLKGELSEKVFNSTMRFDIAQRHSREMTEKDLLSLRSDLKSWQSIEVQRLEKEINGLEKRMLERREQTETRFSLIHAEIAQVEKRILQYGGGMLVSLMTVGLGIARLLF